MDSINDALIDCIKALGGSKQVGPVLWPEKTPDAAQRLLLACLNEDRPERLSPEHFVFVLKMAHGKGRHDAFDYLAQSLGYAKPIPIEPHDEAAELQKQFIAATEAMQQLAARMESLTLSNNRHLRAA